MIDWIADLRTFGEPVFDQGTRRVCLSIALTYAHEAEAGSDLSLEFLHWASGNHGVRSTIPAALSSLLRDGQPPRPQWEFDAAVDDMDPSYAPPPTVTGGYSTASCRLVSGIDEVVRTLVSGRLVVLALRTSPQWLQLGASVITTGLPRLRGHAVVAVAAGILDDAIPPFLDSGERVVCVRNSWGERWGARGFGLLSERAFAESVDAALVVDVV